MAIVYRLQKGSRLTVEEMDGNFQHVEDYLTGLTASIDTLTTNLASATASVVDLQPNYKIYTALLTQSGTASPTATVLENTIGDIVFTRDDVGYYIGTLADAFTIGKTLPYSFSSATGWNNYTISCERDSDDTVAIFLESAGSPLEISASGYEIFIKIKVYN